MSLSRSSLVVSRDSDSALQYWLNTTNLHRIHEAVAEGLQIVDVDGSYLHRKQQSLKHSGVQVAPLPPPLAGWEIVTDSNVDTVSVNIPIVTSGKYAIIFSYIFNVLQMLRNLVHLLSMWYWSFSNARGLSSSNKRIQSLGIWPVASSAS